MSPEEHESVRTCGNDSRTKAFQDSISPVLCLPTSA